MQDNGTWKGEKVLARSLIFDGKIFFTSYLPEGTENSNLCGSAMDGGGRLYAVDLLTANAVYKDWSDNPLELEESDRSSDMGDGIPSEPVVLLQKNGATVMATASTKIKRIGGFGLPREPTFWLQEAIDGDSSGGRAGMCSM